MHKVSTEEFVSYFCQSVAELDDNERVRMVCGEAPPQIYRQIGQELQEVNKRGVKTRVIAGPVFFKDDSTGSNPLIELGDNGFIELIISPYRQMGHFTVFGLSDLMLEKHHDPLADVREISYIFLLDEEGNVDPFSAEHFSNYIYSKFDGQIEGAYMKNHKQSNFIIAPQETIRAVHKVKESLYDFTGVDEFIEIAERRGLEYDFVGNGKSGVSEKV